MKLDIAQRRRRERPRQQCPLCGGGLVIWDACRRHGAGLNCDCAVGELECPECEGTGEVEAEDDDDDDGEA